MDISDLYPKLTIRDNWGRKVTFLDCGKTILRKVSDARTDKILAGGWRRIDKLAFALALFGAIRKRFQAEGFDYAIPDDFKTVQEQDGLEGWFGQKKRSKD